ncbi:hypothetical protein CDL15_Pgr008102 [Punica granatum]|uniref:Uncharacterized protein n=1 Tax=Punica granatum TaxID=22663 RepID=A0A218W304_PUNGR|nr:hypothetical protein CDL15_Pgr008102 [Punica granatum]
MKLGKMESTETTGDGGAPPATQTYLRRIPARTKNKRKKQQQQQRAPLNPYETAGRRRPTLSAGSAPTASASTAPPSPPIDIDRLLSLSLHHYSLLPFFLIFFLNFWSISLNCDVSLFLFSF